eukprot:TRINITY_DN6090_c0_g1_i2.p1 TRINITY_DN6090_c0_g1~~TRINITY_DN6090_c0_g1_i2.p1  ORF type:complete len:286 (+),score=63.67 TRINITY_DN6090_c0_g1_i2:122-979(+)
MCIRDSINAEYGDSVFMEPCPAVMDSGSRHLRYGVAGEDAPSVTMDSVTYHQPGMRVAFLLGSHPRAGSQSKVHELDRHLLEKIFCEHIPPTQWRSLGREAAAHWHRGDPGRIVWPFSLDSWDPYRQESLLAHATTTLPLPSRSILCTDPVLLPKPQREARVEQFFEAMEVGNFYLITSAVLSLYGTGRTTGLSVDLGHDRSAVVPVYEGYALPHAIKIGQVAGRVMTEHVERLLERKESAEAIKERCCTLWDLSLIHISEPTRLLSISYAVFCLKKKKKRKKKK